jgi:hypothetical protein
LKVLRAHLVGLTIGLLFVGMAMGLHYKDFSIFLESSVFEFFRETFNIGEFTYQFIVALLLFLIFIVATWIGSWFVLLATGICFLFLTGSWISGFLGFLIMLGKWYFVGYLFGAVFTTLYNDIVYLILRIRIRFNGIPFLGGQENRFVFAYNPCTPFNIIKSPVINQELQIPGYLERLRLYDYEKRQPVPDKKSPYTILFIANPSFLKRYPGGPNLAAYRNNNSNYITDPIINDLDLFIRGVSQGLRSFDSNEVLGHPDIWSHVRIITIFDDQYPINRGSQYGLVEANQQTFGINNQLIENLAEPIPNLYQNLQNIWADLQSRGVNLQGVNASDVDVIFALSAVRENNRSTAQFSGGRLIDPGDVNYSYNGTRPNYIHECLVNPYPGRVALNVIDARTKTYIHEFAHAMSHDCHGALIDEYFDLAVVGGMPQPFVSTFHTINRINRIDNLNNPAPGATIPQRMVDYDSYPLTIDNRVFWTDRQHPSCEENWTGYFAERPDMDIGCTMDSTFGRYHFDNLICAFMYDRLRSKVVRYL